MPNRKDVRQRVIDRYSRTCQCCGKRGLSGNDCHIDHLIPTAKGGSDEESNLALLCGKCNTFRQHYSADDAFCHHSGMLLRAAQATIRRIQLIHYEYRIEGSDRTFEPEEFAKVVLADMQSILAELSTLPLAQLSPIKAGRFVIVDLAETHAKTPADQQ